MTAIRTYDAAVREVEHLRGELVEETPGRASREELSRWADDPVGWDLEAGRDPVDYQRAVMESVASTKRTAWRACHAAGKDFTIGSLAVWAAYARDSLVLVVSATERQVLHQTMKEVRKAWRAARKAHGIGGQLFQGSVRIAGEDRIVALTGSANVDALTGWHDDENGVFVAISEGQGERLEDAAYDAAESNVTTSHGRILAAGNPVRPEGRFYRIHQRGSWTRFQTSAFDTPNVKAGELVRPGFPAPDWPQDVAGQYGEDSAFYRGRVLASFPTSTTDSLVRHAWVERAVELGREGRFAQTARETPPVLAVDVARFGDDRSAVAIRRGPVVEEIRTWGKADTMETVERVVGVWEELEAFVSHIVVDLIGIGAGVLDRLQETKVVSPQPYTRRSRRTGLPTGVGERRTKVEGFDARKKAHLTERFHNLRSQAWWTLRERLEAGELALPDDPKLVEEIVRTPYRVTERGTVWVRKDDLKDRIGRSPDRADAVVMSLAPELSKGRKRFHLRSG